MILSERLKQAFPSFEWHFDVSLADVTYFKLGGPAEAWVELQQVADLAALVAWCHQAEVPLTILGGGSNVLVSDQGVKGVVVRLQAAQVELISKNPTEGRVRAQAGVKMALLVKDTLDWGLAGLEYFLGVPGTLGGAIVNNAHYLADLIGQHVDRVQVVTATGEIKWLSQAECHFGYDSSRFQTSGEVVWQVEFKLAVGTPEVSRELVKKATVYRASSQPLGEPSSGCIFQNVPNSDHLKQLFPQFADKPHISAGFLIDQAGLKGTQVGQIAVSHKHAAFMINLGGGTASQVTELIKLVKARVKAAFGVDLREEVFYLE